MAAPLITVELFIPGGLGWRDVSAATSIDSSVEITEAIEAPSETNMFVAPDVTLKLMQGGSTEFTFSMLAGLTPESTDFLIRISRDGTPIFLGFILPNTVQFNDQEQWCSFTAIGMAGKLARTAADSIAALKRVVDPGWRVSEAGGGEAFGTVTIYNTSGPMSLCEIEAGDTVTIGTPGGQEDEVRVIGVAPTTDTAPYDFFELSVSGLTQSYAAGSVVTLITPFVRNIPLINLVAQLFIGAGLNAPTTATFLAAPLSGAATPFATPVAPIGVGTALGVSSHVTDIIGSDPPGSFPICGTSLGVWGQANPPTGGWTIYDHIEESAIPVDWRPYGSGKWIQYGPRYQRTLVFDTSVLPKRVTGAIYKFWCYEYEPSDRPVTYYRYRLQIEVDNFDRQATDYQWTTGLYRESSPDGWQWTEISGPHGATNGTTVADLHKEVPLTCGLDLLTVLGVSRRVYYVEPSVATDPCSYIVSRMIASTGAVTANVGPTGYGIRGNVFAHQSGSLLFVRRDTDREDVPQAFTLHAPGADLELANAAAIPADFQPFTLKYNAGDGRWYALAASPENGVRLLAFAGSTLGAIAGYEPPQLFPPSRSIGRVDLTVINGPAGTTFPMLAIFGNQLWWISRSSSGWIEYADLEGLSCGEAVAQLATTIDAYAYVDREMVSWVKARGTSSGRSIITGTGATSTRLDDDGCLSLRRASIWYKAYRHVTVTNERDETIVGEAGNPAFRDTEQGLALSSRFISTQSFADALAAHLLSYLGRSLAVVEVEHEVDERRCEIGRTFTTVVDGVLKTLQIIDATDRPVAGTIRAQGLEM